MSALRVIAVVRALKAPPPSARDPQGQRSYERYRRAAITTLASLGAQAVTTVVTLLSVPLALSHLGATQYGVWMSITSLVAVVAAADLGVGNGLLNGIAEAHGRTDRDLARRYASSAFLLLSGVALFLALIAVVIQPLISWTDLLNTPSLASSGDGRATALVLLGCSFALIPLGIAARIHMGYQEGFINSVWQGVGSVIGLLGLLAAVALDANLPWTVFAFTVGPVLSAGLNLAVLFHQRAWLRPHLDAFHRRIAAKLLGTGLQFAALQAVFAVAFLSDNIVVAHIFGADAVTQYAVHAQLFGFAPLLAGMALSPFWPAYGESIVRGDVVWARKTLIRSVIATIALVGGASVVLLVVGTPLMQLWVGSRVQPSIPLMLALGLWATLSSVGSAVAMFLNGAGMLRAQVVLACMMGPAAVLGKIIGALTFGLPGLVIGTIVAYTVFTAAPLSILMPGVLRRLESRAHEAMSAA